LDVAGDRQSDLVLLGDFLLSTLPSEYDIVVSRDHVHVEWDVKEEEELS